MIQKYKGSGHEIKPQRALASDAHRLHYALSRLREALIRNGEIEIADELKDPVKTFQFYDLFSSDRGIITVAGPQGVGKSLMVNKILGLPEEAWLPVGTVRCERIPIVIRYLEENSSEIKDPTKPVVVYKESLLQETQYYEIETMSYEEGRERAIHPQGEDWVMFWYVKGISTVKYLSPLVVLPGLESDTPWEDTIKYLLNISDVVIYTLDNTRASQEEAESMEKWIKKNELIQKPVVVVTKSSTLGEKEKESFSKVLKHRIPFDPVFIESHDDDLPGYDNLRETIFKAAAQTPPNIQSEKLCRILRNRVAPLLRRSKKLAIDKDRDVTVLDSLAVDKLIQKIDEAWKHLIKDEIIDNAKDKIYSHKEKALERGRKVKNEVLSGVWKSIKRYFAGGPAVEEMIRIEDETRKAFAEGLDEELSQILKRAFATTVGQSPDQEAKVTTKDVLAKIMLSPPTKIGIETGLEDIRKDLVEANRLSAEMSEFLKTRIKEINALSRTFLNEYRRLIKEGDAPAVLTGTGTAGAIEAGLEAIGKGVAGPTASTVAGVIGLAVAATAITGVSIAIVRRNRKLDYTIEEWLREYTAELSNSVIENLEIKLERFWNAFKYTFREDLAQKMGLADDVQNAILLSICVKEADDAVKDIWSRHC